jgi:CheY-like chemotaxis protein
MQQTALIVDDDQPTLLFLQQVLLPLNVQVIRADDGAQAIDILQQSTPDVMFLDLLLPGISGLDVLQFVSLTQRLNDMYTVVISAHNRFQPAKALARANEYLIKPVRVQTIREIMQQVVSRQLTG